MNIPKYSVGEVVIVQSVNYPKNNGEYTVVSILTLANVRTILGSPLSAWSQIYYYELEGLQFNLFSPISTVLTPCSFMGEQSLRKKHIPGEWTFDKLMNGLKSPITENV